MRLVLRTKAGELHTNQARQGDQAEFSDSPGGPKFGNWLRIFRPDLLAGEDKVDGPPRGGLVRPNQHVNACDMPMLKAELCGGFGNLIQVRAAHGDVDVLREASGVRIHVLNV